MKATTQTSPTKEEALEASNQAVKTAYQNILKEIKEALPKFPTEYHRTLIEVDYTSLEITLKFGFFSPLIHLQLVETDGQFIILFSRNMLIKSQIGNALDGLLNRIVYKHTAEANTPVSIEDCLSAEIYKTDDFRNANSLIQKGFKGGKKVTV